MGARIWNQTKPVSYVHDTRTRNRHQEKIESTRFMALVSGACVMGIRFIKFRYLFTPLTRYDPAIVSVDNVTSYFVYTVWREVLKSFISCVIYVFVFAARST